MYEHSFHEERERCIFRLLCHSHVEEIANHGSVARAHGATIEYVKINGDGLQWYLDKVNSLLEVDSIRNSLIDILRLLP